jgi:arylsulfatase A-like enzyme
MAEIDGRLHPSWWVRGGSAAEIDFAVPADEPELRWLEGTMGSGAVPRVELIAGGRSVALDGGSEPGEEARWAERQASLSAAAGQRVRIRLSNAGAGIALFGDPRVVVSSGLPRPSDVLVYLIDTLRADHVGAFGAPYAGITPNLDRLIEEGVAFQMALSHSPWTKPSIATLLTGLLPTTHRVGSRTLSDRLPAGVPVVQARFRQAGWRAGSFTANPLGSTLSGLERGFGTALVPRFWRRRPALGRNPSGAQIRKEVLRWIDQEPDRPFFAYVQVMEVHPSGRAHHGRGRPDGFTAYGASVRAADADLGALLGSLAERGRDDLLVVVLSDHGDSRGVHGWHFKGHGTSLFQDQIHVPVVFWHRSGSRRAPVQDPTGLADVAPTLLELFDLPPLEHADGRALDVYAETQSAEAHPVSSALIRFPHSPNAAAQHAMVDPDYRKVLRIGTEPPLAYDLRKDPSETGSHEPSGAAELLNEFDRRIDALAAKRDHFQERHGLATAEGIDAKELQRLRALGYVQ